MRFWLIAAAALLLSGAVAGAQTAETPPTENQVTRVLVLGDALGGGLGAGLSRVAEAAGDYEVSTRLNEESGLARPEVYDWTATVPKILRNNVYDVIVVMLGANDTQAIRADGARIPFEADEWAAAYGAQIDRLLSALAVSGARIIWVGPPPMRDPKYDAAIKTISAIQRARVEAQGLTFIDMRPELSAPDGSYADTGPDDTGTVTKLRGRDGISFYKAGNNRMGQIVLAVIDSGGALKPAQPGAGGGGRIRHGGARQPGAAVRTGADEWRKLYGSAGRGDGQRRDAGRCGARSRCGDQGLARYLARGKQCPEAVPARGSARSACRTAG